ncbi:MAG TPA: hypothetical protein VJ735_18665 [Actinomycetes bacterium]|nr:hypothetical protein [Actinomycetes bacterium]
MLWASAMAGLPVIGWLDQLLRQAGRPDLAPLTPDAVAYVLGLVSAATVGAVLASRRPRHPVGWLLLALALLVVATGVTSAYAKYGLLVRPQSLPGAISAAVYAGVGLPPIAVCLSFILLLTPTGSLPSPRWRWWARTTVAALVLGMVAGALLPFERPYRSVTNPLAMPALQDLLLVVTAAATVVTGLGILVAAWSLLARFRRAHGVERQQLRWVALAAVMTVVVVLAIVAVTAAGLEAPSDWLVGVCMAVVPVAIGAAILRYRLYDLDRIISRTLAYGLLTVLLGLGYAAVVLLLGRLLPQGSSVGVAAATLAVAAVFQPARRRIQQLVDQRFNRRRHDAAKQIAAFSGRLHEQVDLGTLTAELLALVDLTMQPTTVSIWLRPSVDTTQDHGVHTHPTGQPTVAPRARDPAVPT